MSSNDYSNYLEKELTSLEVLLTDWLDTNYHKNIRDALYTIQLIKGLDDRYITNSYKIKQALCDYRELKEEAEKL